MSLRAGWYTKDGVPAGYPGCWGLSTYGMLNPGDDQALHNQHGDSRLGPNVYVMGGIDSRVPGAPVGSSLARRYNLNAGTWSSIATMPGTPRYANALAAHGGYVYSVGGEGGSGINEIPANEMVLRYSPGTDSWTNLPSPLPRRTGGHLLSLGQYLYFIGGWYAGSRADAWRYDPTANSWIAIASLPQHARAAAHTVYQGRLIIAGGQHDWGGGITTNLNNVQAYDPATGTWSTLAPLPATVTTATAAVLDGVLHVYGGYLSTGPNLDHWIYDDALDAWNVHSTLGITGTAQSYGVAGAFNGALYNLTGGRGAAYVPTARSAPFPATVGFSRPGCQDFPELDAPVTLHMSESLTGVFADPTVDATFFSLVDLPVGSPYSIGDHISGRTWYAGTIRDKSIQGGLTSYSLETLLATLGRVTPREALILVAGEGGVPSPLTLRECLIRFLNYYGVPYDPDIPEFYLRAGEELVVPTVPAFVIQPDQLNPASIYAQLEPFYGVFRSYTFRADEQNQLVVGPPSWVDTIGVRLNLWRRRQENDRTPTRQTNGVPWSTTRKPTVEWTATVDGVSYSGSLLAPLELGAPLQSISIGPITVRIQWRSSDNRVQASVWPPPPVDLTVGSLYAIAFTLRPETLPGDEDELLDLTVADLGPDEVQTSSADTVINQAVIPVRPRTFQPAQQIMQAAAMVLASPGGLMPGLFGNSPFGPMDEELETPNGFLELVNDTVQEGAWFWPADEAVVIQPGGNITVAFDVEEWAEQWRDANAPHAAASQVNTFSDTFDLPANGAEVRLFDFQFPRQTTNFAPSPYGARGTVFGRWRAGENPGIELRVANSHFVEFGYLPEMGIFGQTVYFLWGAIVKLNGTGTTFTVGDLHTYRFGFSRGADGLWEDAANVPGLSESQALYPNRVYTAPELPYEVTPEIALAMARGIVEENLTPKVVYSLTVPATRPDGYAVGPWHMGRAADIPALGVRGRVTSLDYSEAHTAQAQGDTSLVTVDVETTTAPPGSRAAATGYRRAAYGLSHYQQEE